MSAEDERRLERWRLVLGGGAADGTGVELDERHQAMDDCMSALYDAPGTSKSKKGGLAASAPRVSRWLGELRRLFDAQTVQWVQRDAVERLGMTRLLLEPELLASLEPDVGLVATLLALKDLVPDTSREAVRQVVRTVARQLRERLAPSMQDALRGTASRRVRTRRPRAGELDAHLTIRRNLSRYQPSLGTIVPTDIYGLRRSRRSLGEMMLVVDQSASMASSLIHACVCAAILAEQPSLETSLLVFDAEVVDLSEVLRGDVVDLLLGVELGGGTDIERAVAYAQAKLRRPAESTVVLVSDLYEGGDEDSLVGRLAWLVGQGARVVVLLALDEEGVPSYDEELAKRIAELGIAVLACPPRRFPELMAAVLEGRPVPPGLG